MSKGDRQIPSGFFSQPGAENVSAVMFTKQGTISKFNRMGARADFGSARLKFIRRGFVYNPDPDASVPIPWAIEIDDPEYEEQWSDEIEVFHNPNAVVPLDERFFPGCTHHRLKGDQMLTSGRTGIFLGSITHNFLDARKRRRSKRGAPNSRKVPPR